jgi:hypothetical protein
MAREVPASSTPSKAKKIPPAIEAPPTRWLMLAETAELTRFSCQYITLVISRGELKAYYPRVGRAVRLGASDVEAFTTGEQG